MSGDLILKPSCDGCRTTNGLYGTTWKHLTLCISCGKTIAENQGKCRCCGVTITRLIREYNVRICSRSDNNYFIGRFPSGVPTFSEENNVGIKWTIQKEVLQGHQVTKSLQEKFKNKPWLLKNESGQFQYQGVLDGAVSPMYYLLIVERKEIVAIPAGSWYKFNKIAKCPQLTLEQAEEMMKNRSKNAEGYKRWMMKGRKMNVGEEDEEEESARKSRLGLNKGGGDLDMDDDDIEKGDDWEHEEIFTDDDEAVGNDPDEHGDLAPEIPPPEIKQNEEDEEETNEEEGGLSESGKEIKKLLNRIRGMNESDQEEDDANDEVKPVKDGMMISTLKGIMPAEAASSSLSSSGPASTSGPVTEDEFRAVLMLKTPVTTADLSGRFKFRLKSKKDRDAVRAILKKISKIQRRKTGGSYVMLKDK